jgi:hypothetical protein
MTSDYVPSAPITFDCCFENLEDVKLEELPFHISLVNIMSSIDDLRLAGIKTEEMQQIIKDQEKKHNEHMYMIATSWGSAFGIICMIAICICCSCCCCKCCRNCFFWLWDRWSPRDCWKETQDKCCVSIHNYNGPRVEYVKTDTSPAISIKSLPELENITTNQPKRATDKNLEEEELESISKRTRSKSMFR